VGGAAETEGELHETGSVLVDIGEDRGALVLWTDQSRSGAEVEVRRKGEADKTHVQVLPRHTATGVVYAAVFPSLPAGIYEIMQQDGTVDQMVMIRPASVLDVLWPVRP
jgi:hypothetical protein